MKIHKRNGFKSYIVIFIISFLIITFGFNLNLEFTKENNASELSLQANKFINTLLGQPVIEAYASTTDLFDDVKPSDWFYKEVGWAVNEGITVGVEERKFAPNEICNNAQIITYLWRAFGEPDPSINNPFNNISETDYYYKAVIWAYEKGIIIENQFEALNECTRLNAVTYLWRSAGSPTPTVTTSFSDISTGLQAVDWAVEQNITNGYEGDRFSPYTTCTRAQIVVFLYRDSFLLINNSGENPPTNPGTTTTDTLYNGLYKIEVDGGVYEVYVENGTIRPDSLFTFTHDDGTVYEGTLANNVFTGYCNISYPNGDSYSGNLSRNKKDGNGTYIWFNGDSYIGLWSDDKMNGEGIYYFANGSYIEGSFRNNQPVGICYYYDGNGSVYISEWQNGECVSIRRG